MTRYDVPYLQKLELQEVGRNDRPAHLPRCEVTDDSEAVVRTAVNPEIEKQFEESQTLYNRFHKGKAIQVNQRGYRIPFYDRPPASDSFFSEGGAMPVADNPRQNWGRLLEITTSRTSLNRLGC